MPIRINLLAESQALEELRRRDPVKRAIWGGAILVGVLLAYSIWLQLGGIGAKREVNGLRTLIVAQTNEYQRVLTDQKKLGDANFKLAKLLQLSTNRFLNGSVLNALQLTTVEDVQLVRLRTEQNYVFNEETKAKTNEFNRVIPGKPASVTEKIVVTLDAKDSSPNPGDQVTKFKEAVAGSSYFQNALGKTNDIRLTSIPDPQGKFTIECRYPEKTR